MSNIYDCDHYCNEADDVVVDYYHRKKNYIILIFLVLSECVIKINSLIHEYLNLIIYDMDPIIIVGVM